MILHINLLQKMDKKTIQSQFTFIFILIDEQLIK